ncbi:helix-turn-helix transcriptional regulator [Haladaptatus salinisoli]|uniref:helix-turn-helix transcriptional regulator n=1 Tax=Haladaptatus salinisoli TaxID=2884876 RepID=UPI001D09A388|nr:HTH domain-containing protein [Haladaptatus salinisoli]
MTETGDDLNDTIATVTKRSQFLSALSSGPIPKRDLGDELGVSRSTVYKAVRELREHDLVERTDAGLELTLAGRLLEAEYDAFRGCVEDVRRTRQLLSILPTDCDLPMALLDDATVALAERHAPNHPVQYVEEIVSEADVTRGFSPVALPQYVELFHEQAVRGDLSAELVLERPVVRYLVTDYGDRLQEALRSGGLSVWETTDTLPFGLIAVEGERDGVCVVVYDERGELRGLVANHTREATAWGRELFESYRDGADYIGGG